MLVKIVTYNISRVASKGRKINTVLVSPRVPQPYQHFSQCCWSQAVGWCCFQTKAANNRFYNYRHTKLGKLYHKLPLWYGSVFLVGRYYWQILQQLLQVLPSRWYLWTVYKIFTCGVLKGFVTFMLIHPVCLFCKNPVPKVSYVLSVSATPGLGKNAECNLSMK